ncbi:MAG: S-adenosylmethionine decarboxylase proenzyme [Epsilonproteobacteria bacterium]|nr:S-adenosylmethionine decarboxylase proenzyme [Campylobacterota bacterium]NPA56302.1 S-adenosylmethionine decarboxylase proenzyme [Campylobacterota bacterium]
MKSLGKHLLAEYYRCDEEAINDVGKVEQALIRAAEIAGATVIGSSFHRFEPYGVSGVVVISESHLTIHTWPEYRFAAVDVFTCGDHVDPMKAHEYLKGVFGTENATVETILRGVLNIPDLRHKPGGSCVRGECGDKKVG